MTMRRRGATARLAGWLLGLSIAAAGTAVAQDTDPIGRFAVDVHGATIRFKQTTAVADGLGLETSPAALPGRGVGVDVGAHVYPFRWRAITFGVGASVHTSGAKATPVDDNGDPSGPEVTVRLTAYSPQVSFNFGHARGWSYISGGLGVATLPYTVAGERADAVTPRRKTINYGGGARWYVRRHLAFSFDIRFYAINPVAATADTAASPRMTLLVLSAGISLK